MTPHPIDTDTTALQERLWEAIAEVRDYYPRMPNDAPTDDVVADILPIIAAEVRKAQADALRDAADHWQDNADHNTPADIDPEWLRTRATDIKETP